MMKNSTWRVDRTLAFLSLATLAACGGEDPPAREPQVTVVTAGQTITAGVLAPSVAGGIAATADDPRWEAIPAYRTALVEAPAVHASAGLRDTGQTVPLPVTFRIAAGGADFLIWLRWPDPTRDDRDEFEQFADGAAVQFALAKKHETSFMMGTPFAPVNIWHWKASSDHAQNLAAGGFGTLTPLPVQDVAASSRYDAATREWTVVFARARAAAGEYIADFSSDNSVRIAFAVWQGADRQRDGDKRTLPGWITVSAPSAAPGTPSPPR